MYNNNKISPTKNMKCHCEKAEGRRGSLLIDKEIASVAGKRFLAMTCHKGGAQ